MEAYPSTSTCAMALDGKGARTDAYTPYDGVPELSEIGTPSKLDQ